jgi:hypothetical protein
MNLVKIVSGGQTGVDQAALRAARACGLAIGGWCPPGRACEAGHIPEDLPLVETPEDRAPASPDVPRSMRTEWNVRDSDATLILSRAAASGPGAEWTLRCSARYGRPLLVCNPAETDTAERIKAWLEALPIRVLNVAGPSESGQPGVGAEAEAVLRVVFAGLRRP